MTAREIRRSFLAFFQEHGHRIVPSSSLVPMDDPTLLFTNAGMNQFKDLFLGKERREYTRAASVQKCMRVSGKHNDLESVGPSPRHHTFFEMLGNFSFGDYFKREAIGLAWSLLTEAWRLPPERLYATIFKGEAGIPRDDEAYGGWRRFLPESRIFELGLADNFWAMGETGPCGRCSEVHYFRGDRIPCSEARCLGITCSCDRFVEIWNNVFMEFDRQADGALQPLPAPSIDTGMGLERMAAVLQDAPSNYDTDLFRPILKRLGELASVTYSSFIPGTVSATADIHMRVIADHLRATTFLIADGVLPSNEWRGYVLRKIMRRAMRHGKLLYITEPFLYRLVDVLVEEMGDAYPELGAHRETIATIVQSEETRFEAVLNRGLPYLEAAIATASAGGGVISGDETFRLYDTYGLPVDFVEDIASERSVTIDRDGYQHAMEAQRERARAGSTFTPTRGRVSWLELEAPDAPRSQTGTQEPQSVSKERSRALEQLPDQFDGYEATRVSGVPIVVLFDEERRQVVALHQGQSGWLLLQRTPFYVEAGGQVSDRGRICAEPGPGDAVVDDMARLAPTGPRLHHVQVTAGRLGEGDLVTAEVDATLRDATRRNHTATHLLHAALRQVLGPHVNQAGSLVAPDRLRFDFVHVAPLTCDEIEALERLVNEHILQNAPVVTDVRATREAIAAGAMALFGEKYGDEVRVVSVPGFSMELCGGTHCRATGDIGCFVIVHEMGVAAGVRRVEALTGAGALRHFQTGRATLDSLAETLNAPADQAVEAIRRLQAENKRLAREVAALRLKAAMGGEAATFDDVVEVGGVKMLARRVSGLDRAALRGLADSLKERLKSGVVVLASAGDGKVSVVVSVTPDLKSRIHAGEVVRQIAPIVGGGGGGRPEFAEAGGRDPDKIDELLARSREVVRAMAGA